MGDSDLDEVRLGFRGDAFYERLMQVHEGLSNEESHALNARLVLLMANQTGDAALLEQIVEKARGYNEQTSNSL